MIDRAVYEIAALYDPAAPPSPFTDEPGWNGRLVYTFGGGCNVGYHQGTGNGGVLTDLFLARGYAVASSSLNVYDNNCSEVISAEVALMVKEHFAETYGKPAYTIGWGGSGGAIQQHLIGNNYPGILDGIVPGVSFQDSITLGTVPDCRLLSLYFASPAGIAAGWTAAQRAAASGFGTFNSCLFWHLAFASRTNALEACPARCPCRRGTTRSRTRAGSSARASSRSRRSSAATRRTASPGGRSTTSASSTGSPRSRAGRSRRSSSSR